MNNVITPFEQLKQDNIQLAKRIANADQVQDWEASMQLKKILYNNKLLMIEMLEYKNSKPTISMTQHFKNVESMPKIPRYRTGLRFLDDHMVDADDTKNIGIEQGSYVVIGGASGGGKTTMTLDILANVSRSNKCVLFNFEMGDKRISKRMKKLLHNKEQADNLLINNSSRSLQDLTGEIKILANDGIKFFVIDSRMKITIKGSRDPEYIKIAQVSRELSELSAKLDIIIIMINQIAEEDLKNGRMSFKGSGDQLYDADIAWFIIVEKDDNGNIINRKIVCAKNRQDEFTYSDDIPTKAIEIGYAE